MGSSPSRSAWRCSLTWPPPCRPGPTDGDTLLGLFWPELEQDHARNALSQAVHFLRRSLGDAAIISRGGEDLALADAVCLGGRAGLPCCARRRPPRLRHSSCTAAIYLPSFFVPGSCRLRRWLEQERGRLRDRAGGGGPPPGRSVTRRAPAHAGGRLAHRALELADTDERHLRRMIALLSRVGDRAGAVRAYERFAVSRASLAWTLA